MLSLREEQYAITRSANNAQIDEIIDIDKCYITDPPLQSDFITLDETEKRRIESGNWLTDDIIDAGQIILAEQFRHDSGRMAFKVFAWGILTRLRLSHMNLYKSCMMVMITDSLLVQ